MANLNRVLIAGRLARNPELRHTPNNHSVCAMTIAINRHYTASGGQKQQDTTFVDAESWNRTAEVIHQYFKKGQPILIEGRLKQDRWQDQSGANRSKLKVLIENFEFLSGSGSRDHAAQEAPQYELSDPPGRQAPRQRQGAMANASSR